MAEPDKKKGTAEVAQLGRDSDLEQIREIIFGAQARDYQRRLELLQQKVEASLGRLDEQVTKQMEALESSFDERLAAMTDKLGEQATRAEDELSSLDIKLAGMGKELAEQLNAVDEFAARATGELKQQLDSEVADVRKAGSDALARLKQELESALGEVDHLKLGREKFADLLDELARRLRD